MGSAGSGSRKHAGLAVLSIALILVGSICAQLFNTSFYSTKVSRIRFATPTGTLSGLLYMPKGAGPADPRPTIIATHGYLNSAEMQDAGAIEMSRRGYIVLALDMYDHGHSVNATKFGKTPAFFTFWPTSLYDAVQYMYGQNYVLKDPAGNGLIAVAGHSMGGFSATMAMVLDEGDFGKTGIRKIHAGLTMGSDYRWSSLLKVSSDVASAAFGPRIVGKVAAHYDEFFFDADAEKSGKTVVHKDYLKTKEGQEFLGFPAQATEGSFYTLPNGGKRVIFMPTETHPWNHFSPTTTGDQIKFYAEALGGYASAGQAKAGLAAGDQIWFFKELSEFVALIGFFLLFIPLVSLLLKIPGLASARTQAYPAIEGATTRKGKAAFWVLTAFAILFPALVFPALMDRAGAGMTALRFGSLALAAISLIAGIVASAKRKGDRKDIAVGTALTVVVALLLFGLVAGAKTLFPTDAYFASPTTSQIIYWALGVTAVTAYIALASHYLSGKPRGVQLRQYGLAVGWKAILASLAVAVIAIVAGYAVLFLVDAAFKTDFRLWVWAVKTFDWRHVVACLRYAPFFFLYYYAVSITLNANTGRLRGWKGSLLACAINAGGLVLFLAAQYGALFLTETALLPAQALSSILLFALVPSLIVAALYARRFYRETNNVYLGAFLNTLLMTMITIANTTVYSGL